MASDDKVMGYEKEINLKCPHCSTHSQAELIELRIFTRIYVCKNCKREIHKNTTLGSIFPFWGSST
jgi:DNA-directed RNA polymerase subunit RPC12/RpoP